MPVFQPAITLLRGNSQALMPLKVWAAGTYLIPISLEDNSLLSTLFVQAISGATLTVDYYDYTLGSEVGEETHLRDHTTPADGVADRILISNVHNKPVLRVIVAGGTPIFSIYATAVSSKFSTIDAGMVLDDQATDLPVNTAMPVAGVDDVNGVFKLARVSPEGYWIFTDSSAAGVGKVFESSSSLAVGVEVSILSSTVPTLKSWTINFAEVQSRGYGRWQVKLDGVRIGGGITGPEKSSSRFQMPNSLKAIAGQVLDVLYTYSHGPAAMSVEAFLGVVEQ